jgi:hypothetical protein
MAHRRLRQAQERDELTRAHRLVAPGDQVHDLHPGRIRERLEHRSRRVGVLVVERVSTEGLAAVDHVERLHIDVYRNDVCRYVKRPARA